MEATAFPPPPPTPITFIFAILAESGLTSAILLSLGQIVYQWSNNYKKS
jgi:hypothetical protein